MGVLHIRNKETGQFESIRTIKGESGNGIASAVLNADYTLTLNFTDGTSYTTPSIRGATGATGSTGGKGDKGDTGSAGVSITKVEQTTTSTADGGTNVITVTLSNGQTFTFNIKNGSKGSTGTAGVGITSVAQTTTSSADGGNNIITVTKTDGTTSTFTVKNGSKGSTGANGTSCTHSWSGTTLSVTSASGTSSANLKGDKGDKGDKGSDATVTKENVEAALGYTPANAETVSQLSENKLDKTALPTAVNSALAQAKESGEFDGEKGDPGADYVISDADIAELLSELRATANQQTPLFASSTADCTDTSKVYVLPDGYIYGYVKSVPEITIETKSGGYYNNNGAFTSASNAIAQRTNLIPVKEGEQFEYTGQGKWNASVIWFTDENETKLSHAAYGDNTSSTVTVTITVPAQAKYARFYSYYYTGKVLDFSVTPLTISYSWVNTGHAFVPADYEDRIVALESIAGQNVSVLKGKKIVYDGDSICESRTGSSANNGGGYAKLIADRVGGTYVNQAVGGARLTTKPSDKTYHSVVDNLSNLPKDGDLYCFEGGINDYWTPKTLGTFSKTDFTGTLDTNTICGALETIFRYALTNFVGKPVCFVIVHKIQSTAYTENANGDTFEDYRNAMVGICNKYSIPYYDAFSESGLNGWNTAQKNAYLTSNTNGTADGTHPNADGYKRYYVPQLIQLFERIMPV